MEFFYIEPPLTEAHYEAWHHCDFCNQFSEEVLGHLDEGYSVRRAICINCIGSLMIGKKYKHFKGDTYKVLAIAMEIINMVKYVVYTGEDIQTEPLNLELEGYKVLYIGRNTTNLSRQVVFQHEDKPPVVSQISSFNSLLTSVSLKTDFDLPDAQNVWIRSLEEFTGLKDGKPRFEEVIE